MEAGTYSELIEEAREALFALSADGVIWSWNRGAEEAYGFPRAEAIGHRLVELTVPEREVEVTRELIASANSGVAISARGTRRTKHGALVQTDITMTRVTTQTGIVYLAVAELDITRLVERDDLEKKLEEVRRLKSEFLANMSHELRTPLSSIIGFAELMHKGKVGPMAPDHIEFLGDIITSSRRLLQLVNDVLDLARLESGKIEYHPNPVDLPQLVQEIHDILKGLINDKRIKVEVAIDPSVAQVVVDGTRMKQVLYTLLSNAVKFTPAGGRIAIRAQLANANEWTLAVEDTGIGIAADDLQKLFVEFPRIGAGASRDGTGLGLALAQRIVEGHGGRLEATSTVGTGSTFVATLPRVAHGG
jgi:PAS domain S-box-containing protein